ncbi:peptidylprolyl isomerase [Lampropedia aestuarii]|uniref:peptidylprolyl isomerase n=1 Tax=Lampropedia aestuarii TaxID=2562762 RepID=UPI0024690D93|nr:peptidylprolyl isomerase [Lampropedia aestuarii]MDH5856417.1 peptidylprolyl isomerase [Lampropedia aestuarii]
MKMKSKALTRALINSSWPAHAARLLILGVVATAGLAQAQQGGSDVLLRDQKHNVEVTRNDIQADAASLPAVDRYHALSAPPKIEAVAHGLLVRSVLAEQAKQQGLDKSAEAQARLRQAQNRVLMDLLIEHNMQTKTPSEADLLKYAQTEYKLDPDRFKAPAQKKISHILIAGDSSEAKTAIENIYTKLQGNADFGELAFTDSDDQVSAAQYGSLGFLAKGQTVPAFEEQINTLQKKGDYTKPFQTRFGWHIARLDDERDAGLLPFDSVKADLMEEARLKALGDARDTLLNQAAENGQVDEAAINAFAEENKKKAQELHDKS